MLLPTEKTPPKGALTDLTVLAYGPTKIGKSTWCAQAPDALFLSTEPGLNSLEVYQLPVRSWDELLAACAEIAEGKHQFKTVVLDTVDNAYKMCAEHICKKFKVEHEADLAYGKGFSLVNGEFQRVLNKLAFMPYGLYLISHSQEIEIETRTGKLTKIVPTLPEKARKIVLGLVDMVLYCDLDVVQNGDAKPTVRRVMRTKPSVHYEAGDRTGRLPEVIELNYQQFAGHFAGSAESVESANCRSSAPTKGSTKEDSK